VLDLTANYVPRTDPILQEAIKKNGESLKSFVTAQVLNIWRKVKGDGDAWKEESKLQFLSLFGDNYDLQMDEHANQERLIDVLNKLVKLGVKGFRLKNAKHFNIRKKFGEEVVNNPAKPYQQQTHTKTTYLQRLVPYRTKGIKVEQIIKLAYFNFILLRYLREEEKLHYHSL
jgi:glycosidase